MALFVLYILLLNLEISLSSSTPYEHDPSKTGYYRLYNDLFAHYNPLLLPRRNAGPGTYVNITLEFELNTVSGLDEVNQVMYTAGFIVAEWYDEILTWIPSKYAHIQHLVVPPNKVWLPDIAIKNSATSFYDVSFTRDFRVDIRSDGRIIWSYGGNFATSCTLDMTYYPFDLQKCDIFLENWSYTMDAVNLESRGVMLQEFSENGEWKLDHTSTMKSTFEEDTHKGKQFPRVIFSIYLRRKFRYYLINMILPAMFIITISLTVFWLPPDSGEKVSLGITVLLAFSVFQLVIMEHTPRTSDFTPVMTMLFTIIMGESTFSVLVSILTLYYHHHGAETRPPKIVRYLAFNILAKVLCMMNQVPPPDQKIPEVNQDLSIVKRASSIYADRISLDDNSGENGSLPNHSNECDHNKMNYSGNPPKSTNKSERYLQGILAYIKELTAKIHIRERDEVIMREWKCVARIVDRFFFWVAFVFTAIAVPVLLFHNDTSHD